MLLAVLPETCLFMYKNMLGVETCALLSYYAAFPSSMLKVPIGDGTSRLSRNVGKKLHYSLRNNPEERSSHLLRSGSLKSRMLGGFFLIAWPISS
jgi:hypothetical protein